MYKLGYIHYHLQLKHLQAPQLECVVEAAATGLLNIILHHVETTMPRNCKHRGACGTQSHLKTDFSIKIPQGRRERAVFHNKVENYVPEV